jgi:ribosomal protein L39E
MLQPLPAPQKFRFAEMGATVACPATAQQDAWHKSDHSNDAGTRLLTIIGSIHHAAPVHCINARTTSEPTLRGVFAEAAAKICPDVKLDVRKDQDAKKKKKNTRPKLWCVMEKNYKSDISSEMRNARRRAAA